MTFVRTHMGPTTEVLQQGLRSIHLPLDILERCDVDAVDDDVMSARLQALLTPVRRWRSAFFRGKALLQGITKEHLVPLANLIEEKADVVTWRSAHRFTMVFKGMLDVVYALRESQVVQQYYIPVRSAMHLMFGLEQAHLSLTAMREGWFGGNKADVLNALAVQYDEFNSPFVLSGDEPLRELGRASMYMRQAVGCGNTEAARRLVKTMNALDGHMHDPIVEHSRLVLLSGGVSLVRRYLDEERGGGFPCGQGDWLERRAGLAEGDRAYSYRELDQFEREADLLMKRLRNSVCA